MSAIHATRRFFELFVPAFNKTATTQASRRGKNAGRSQKAFETLESRQLMSASVTGVVYNDLNVANTLKPGDPSLAGVRVYADLGNHNAYKAGDPTALSNSAGQYTITGLTPGSYTLREVVPVHFRQTEPTNNAGHIVTIANSSTHLTGVNFGDTQKVRVSGYVFEDANGDAVQNNGEGTLANVTVYLDTNGDKKLDNGEMQTTTNSSGYWVIGDLAPGKTYAVRVVPPSGYSQSYPTGNGTHSEAPAAGQTADDILFGVRPATYVITSQTREAFAGAGSVSKDLTSDNLGVFDPSAFIKDPSLGDSGTADLTSHMNATNITALGSLSTVQPEDTGEAVENIFIDFTVTAPTKFSVGYDIFGNDFAVGLEKISNSGSSFVFSNNPTTNPNTKSYAYNNSGTLAAGDYEFSFQVFQGSNPQFGTNSFVMNFNL